MAEQKLYFEDVKEGDEGPPVTHELTRTDLVQYAGASGDFNPMHTDEVAAQGAGQPSVFGHGMFSAGLLGKALTDYVGVGNLKRYKVRFTKQTWPGESLTSKVVVTGTRQENGTNLVELECTLANSEGEVKISGDAVAELPSSGCPPALATFGRRAAGPRLAALDLSRAPPRRAPRASPHGRTAAGCAGWRSR